MNNLIKIIEEDIKLFNTAFERTRDCGGFLWVNNNLSILNIEYIKSRHLSSLIALLEGVGKEVRKMEDNDPYEHGAYEGYGYRRVTSDLHQLLEETISKIK